MKKNMILISAITLTLIGCGSSTNGHSNKESIKDIAIPPTTDSYKPDDGRLLASACYGCHGTNGISVTKWDSIAGEDELYKEMHEKKGIMEIQAKGYTKIEIAAIENFLKRLPKAEKEEKDDEHEKEKDDD